MKLSKALLVLALALTFSVPAFAETQNVKVSGSIDAYHFYRSNFDLRDNNDAGTSPVDAESELFPSPFTSGVPGTTHDSDDNNRSEADDYFMTVTQIEVSADLTDNVSTVINIINQRDWNAGSDRFTTGPFGADSSADNEFNVELDLAYVQMKEIFYSPLTLTFGRQDLWFGRGLIIGSNRTAWDVGDINDDRSNIQADEYSAKTAFDAIRATLDFNPWTLDFVYSKIDENAHDPEDDIDLYIVNVNYKFAEYNAVAEVYYVGENDKGTFPTVADTTDADDDDTFETRSNDTHTIGGRVQFDPISQITLGGELAYQFGNYTSPLDDFPPINKAQDNVEQDRSSWMFDVFGTYRWDYEWKPELTIEYVHFSGEDDVFRGASSEYNAWNPLYRGKFYTAYADFREFLYATGDAYDQSAGQNEQFIQIKGSLKPLQDLLIEASWTYLWNDEAIDVVDITGPDASFGNSLGIERDEEIGYEVDLQVTYDYTEDVSFSTLVAWFVPGDYYDGATDPGLDPTDDDDSENLLSTDTAFTVVSSVKVTF